MNKSEFKTFLRSVPKAEIHIHIEAVVSLAGIKKMYKNRFGKEMTKEEQTELFSYNDLNGFIQAFLKVQDLFVSEKDFIIVFKELEKYILNSIDYEYSNGIVEGTNNVIKQIKHAACGYKKFKHLKARVMLIKGIYNPIKQN